MPTIIGVMATFDTKGEQAQYVREQLETLGSQALLVDVGVRPMLAGLVAKPGHDQLVELAQDAQRPLGAIGDGLALAGRG